jgi:hypothetical protein
MTWTGQSFNYGGQRNAYKILVGISEGKNLSRRRCEDNNNMNFIKIGSESVECI